MRTVIVRDVDGRPLARAFLSTTNDGPRVNLDRVLEGKGELLSHYFGKGLRAVLLESGDFRLRGMLSTRWLGSERGWFIDLRPVRFSVGEGAESERMRRKFDP